MPTTLTLTAATAAPLQVTVPTKWADVTLAQFVALHTAPDVVPVELLCGLHAGTLEQLSVQAVAHLATLLAFATDPADVLALLPTPKLPDIGSLPYGTMLLARQHIETTSGAVSQLKEAPSLPHAARLLALYRVQMAYGNPLNMARVAACEAALLAAPVTESYADAAFFLSSYRRWQNGTPPTPPTNPSPKTRNTKRAARSWASGSGRFWAWTRRLVGRSLTTPAS